MGKKQTPKPKVRVAGKATHPPRQANPPTPPAEPTHPPVPEAVATQTKGVADIFQSIVSGTEAVADAAMLDRLEAMFGPNAPLVQMFLTRMAVDAAGGKSQAMRDMMRLMHRYTDPEAIMGAGWGAEGADVRLRSLLANMTEYDTSQRALIVAFTLAGSNVSEACRRAGLSRETHYRLLEEDSRYALAVPQAMKIGDDRRVDRAEAMLDRKVVEGDMSAIKLTLLTKGKNRGYVEKQNDDDEGAHEFFVKLFLKKKAEGKFKDVTPSNQPPSGVGPQLEHRGQQAGGPVPVQSPARPPKAGKLG